MVPDASPIPTGDPRRLGGRSRARARSIGRSGGMSGAPRVPVSWGELIDKITILEIKVERMRAPEAVANARRELELLRSVLGEPDGVAAMKDALAAVNRTIWDIEDAIRAKEAAGSFDNEFIELARGVYQNND